MSWLAWLRLVWLESFGDIWIESEACNIGVRVDAEVR